jgi:hypothetical protein
MSTNRRTALNFVKVCINTNPKEVRTIIRMRLMHSHMRTRTHARIQLHNKMIRSPVPCHRTTYVTESPRGVKLWNTKLGYSVLLRRQRQFSSSAMTIHIFTFQLHTKKRAHCTMLYDSQVVRPTVTVDRKVSELRHRVRRTSTLLPVIPKSESVITVFLNLWMASLF